jgi:hypothetical protein
MKIALFTEGPSDSAVITNVLKGVLNINSSDIQYISPELFVDETDLSNAEDKFSSWTIIKKECEERSKLKIFFEEFEDDSRFVVIQIDSEDRNLVGYDCTKTIKPKTDFETYSSNLRNEVIAKINTWLNGSYTDKIAYAIAIEEIDAWVLTLSSTIKGDTSKINNPKEKLKSSWEQIVSKQEAKKLSNYSFYKRFDSLSSSFRKPKELNKCKLKNKSLLDFCVDLEKFKN